MWNYNARISHGHFEYKSIGTTPALKLQAMRIGDTAPDFSAKSTDSNFKSFYAWKGISWCVFFSHPADFTPVCTTELGAVARLSSEWQKRNVKPLALSCDSVSDHMKWVNDINQTQKCNVTFPIIADEDRKIANMFDMIDPTSMDKHGHPFTVRSVFVIDPQNVIRAMIHYPSSTGRNFDEIIRLIDALQTSDKHTVVTPANWKPGNPALLPPNITDEEAKSKYKEMKKENSYLRYVAF